MLNDFADIADRHAAAPSLAARYAAEARRLAGALELAWDGDWYRRGPTSTTARRWGRPTTTSAAIDSISQSWAVLSARRPPPRGERAMDAVRTHLVRRERAPDPAADAAVRPAGRSDPGYIKGYVPGIRENGGQYTHAALWTIMAVARLGYGDEVVELFHMLNPDQPHARRAPSVERYVTEPYVVDGDVYAHPQHAGRGGWSWYTGSAAWMYRAAVESILGLRATGPTFSVQPCIPAGWPGFTIDWRVGSCRYHVEVVNPEHRSTGVASVSLDGVEVDAGAVPIADDGQAHTVIVTMGERPAAPRTDAGRVKTVTGS